MSNSTRGAGKAGIERGSGRREARDTDPNRVFSQRILRGAELAERLEGRRNLIAAAEPFMLRLRDFLQGSSFFAMLADEEGCILSIKADDAVLKAASSLRMAPGAFMVGGSGGANAIGAAIAEGKPVQVSGEEHFLKACRRWTGSAAPIRDPGGKILGCLDLTGDKEDANPHTLGMVAAAADAIEKTLALSARSEALARQNRHLECLVDSIKAGIISADLDGRILSVNSQALEMFGCSGEELRRLGMPALLPGWQEVRDACVTGGEFTNEDVLVHARANRVYFNLSGYPIPGPGGSTTAVTLVFKDVRKVRKHANDIVGRRAIYTFDKIIGVSKGIRDALEFARKIADSRSTVLISGETGTGKEIFAQAIHNASSRRDEAFVVINCGAIPRTLIESELFGYVDGAFTGARRGGQPGKFEITDGGTIFLDEICEMPLDMQTRLLRVIEEGTVMRVGDNRDIPVDVRVIASTNKDLADEVARGNFRTDLYYRLDVLPIRLPPLRERKEDIPLLVDFYMSRLSRKLNRKPVYISPEYLESLAGLEWPGNIRELENMIELIINSERLPVLAARPDSPAAGDAAASAAKGPPGHSSLEEAEKAQIMKALRENENNLAHAARELGIGRNTLYRKIAAYGLEDAVREGRPQAHKTKPGEASDPESPRTQRNAENMEFR